jgi:hypothetical protein
MRTKSPASYAFLIIWFELFQSKYWISSKAFFY